MMEELTEICTCDDHCESLCPRHGRENLLQDRALRAEQRIDELEQENGRLKDERDWYKKRIELLQIEQKRFVDRKARTLLCDILANGQLLPDPNGKRYPNTLEGDKK